MTKLMKITLISAFMAAGAMAGTIANGVAEIDGDYTPNKTVTISSSGTLKMDSGSIIMGASGAIDNSGTIDISQISDFSKYTGTVTGSEGSVIKIPNSEAAVTIGTKNFIVKGTYSLSYDNEEAALDLSYTEGFPVEIVVSSSGNYENVAAASEKLGLDFQEDATLAPTNATTLTFQNLNATISAMGLETVVGIFLDAYQTYGCVIDLDNKGISDADLALTEDVSLDYGVKGTTKSMTISGEHKVTTNGDWSGMTNSVQCAGDLTFTNKGPSGPISCVNLEFNANTNIEGDVSCASMDIKSGATVKIKGTVTIG